MQQNIFDKHNFYKQIKEVNWVDRELKQIKKKCVKWSEEWCDIISKKKTMIQNSILYKNHYFWVSESMITELLWLTHNESFNDHQEQNWTKSQIKSYYYWSILYHNVDCYTFNCIICKCAKTSQQKPADLLHAFEILQKHWQNLFCNFITDLFKSEDMNVIFTVVNKFLKK